MAGKKPVHTTPNPNGAGWANVQGGQSISTHRTKDAATKAGQRVAKKEEVEHVIHKKDGTIQEKNSYGNDPRSRPG
jgi:uncharacterized protein DUF2188